MADDLSSAPSTGGSEPVSSSAGASSTPSSSDAPATESKAPSAREAISRAMEAVGRAPGETDRAAAVLKDGPGADERLDADHAKAGEDAARAAETEAERSERARRGWETRRENADKAKATEAQTKTITEAVKAAIPGQPPAEQPAAQTQTPVATKYAAPPKRFAGLGEGDWDKVPETVRGEIDRTIRNLEDGHLKYKESADRYAELAEFEQMSQEYYKQPLKETMKNYAELDRLLHTKPLEAFERLASSMTYEGEDGKTYNWTLKQLAQHIVDQDQDTFTSPTSDLERKLETALQKIEQLEKGHNQVRETEVEQRKQTIAQKIQSFASEAPRYQELEGKILSVLKSDLIERTGDPLADLKAAYEVAERLNPAPSLKPPAPEIPASDPAAQRQKGSASVSGAPGSGSSLATRKPAATSNRDAIKMALRQSGIASS